VPLDKLNEIKRVIKRERWKNKKWQNVLPFCHLAILHLISCPTRTITYYFPLHKTEFLNLNNIKVFGRS